MKYQVRLAVSLTRCAALALPLVVAAAPLLVSAVQADPAAVPATTAPSPVTPAAPAPGPPAQTPPTQTPPTQASPAKSAPAKPAPAKTAPASATATADKTATDKNAPVKAGSDKSAPAAVEAPPRKALLEKPAKADRADKAVRDAALPEQVLPTQVSAIYRISFGLLGEIGNFRFKSFIDGDSYALTANAKIDTSIFDYSGAMKSSGAVLRASLARPTGYKFNYRQKALFGKKKVRSLSMAFADGGVKDVTFVPPDPPSSKAIPVTREQLRSALDPLTGVMALSLGDIKHPCDQRLPIFDGKQRFDLVFQPTGRKDGPSGGQICNVRLIPISGHKPGEGAGSVITGNIEVVLRPVPKANILIPYRVTVPTIIGAAVLMSEKVDITMPDSQRIALRR